MNDKTIYSPPFIECYSVSRDVTDGRPGTMEVLEDNQKEKESGEVSITA